jgi:GxxExxY protein
MSYFEEMRKRRLPEGEMHDELTERVIGAAIEVHRHLGPGLTESLYEAALCHEFDLRGISYARQVEFDVKYKDKIIGKSRIDLLVANGLIVELKACDAINSIHRAQCITYLRVTGKSISLLINFNVEILKDGIKRVALNK